MNNNLRVQQYQNTYQRRYYYLGKQQTDKYLLFDRQVNQVGVVSKAWVLEGIQRNCIDNAKVDRGQKIIMLSPIQAKYQNLVIDRLVQEMQKKPAQSSNSESEKQIDKLKQVDKLKSLVIKQRQELAEQKNSYVDIQNRYNDLENKYGDAVRKANDLLHQIQSLQGELDKAQRNYRNAYNDVELQAAINSSKNGLSQSVISKLNPEALFKLKDDLDNVMNRQVFVSKAVRDIVGNTPYIDYYDEKNPISESDRALWNCMKLSINIMQIVQNVYMNDIQRYEKIHPEDIQIYFRQSECLQSDEKEQRNQINNVIKLLIDLLKQNAIAQAGQTSIELLDELWGTAIDIHDNVVDAIDSNDTADEIIDKDSNEYKQNIFNSKVYRRKLKQSKKLLKDERGGTLYHILTTVNNARKAVIEQQFNRDRDIYYVRNDKYGLSSYQDGSFWFRDGISSEIEVLKVNTLQNDEIEFFQQYYNLMFFNTLSLRHARHLRFNELTLDNIGRDMLTVQYAQQQQSQFYSLYKQLILIVVAYFCIKMYINTGAGYSCNIPDLAKQETWDLWKRACCMYGMKENQFDAIMERYKKAGRHDIVRLNKEHIKHA